ncbi:MAG: dihydrofolate reductase [Gammaproteobacteria bacterium]|nr:dihydrofolate reductase [Gammaproteobacteria bacterium]
MMVSLIAAMDENRAIGFNNKLPWHLPDDLKFFKASTQGGVVVMGRKTFESLGCRPLPNRRNIVLTRQMQWTHESIEVAHDWHQLYNELMLQGLARVWIIGGGEIYASCLEQATELVLTQVAMRLTQADAWFPVWDVEQWHCVSDLHHDADERHAYSFNWQRWQRKPKKYHNNKR